MKSIFFDSQITYDGQGNPTYDRPNNASDLRESFGSFISTGIDNVAGTFAVSVSSGLTVSIAPGKCWIKGAFGWQQIASTLTLDAANATYARIDRIILRFNNNISVRSVDLAVLKGTAAASPVAPALTRTDTIYELCLAEITIPSNATVLISSNITDKRYDVTLCPGVKSIFTIETVPVSKGGTGAVTAAAARTNLGLGNAAVKNVGTAAGTVAEGDHTHTISGVTNLQTTLDGKQAKITAPGILKGNGSGGVSPADAAALYSLLNGLTSITPESTDLLPFVDTSGVTAGKMTLSSFANAIGMPQIEFGYYTGTGTYGVDNPNSITFSFLPRYATVYFKGYGAAAGITFIFNPSAVSSGYLQADSYNKIKRIENTVYWYASEANVQYNYSGFRYHYMAIK
ncbi:MAG: hypothetical protein VB118_00145 [Oscillospiraceae bacterium]|nr:hypothetical protein [Oscillospiraceae bacterium]